MSDLVIASRYANGLNAAIPDATDLDEAFTALKSVVALLEQSREFRQVLEHPGVDPDVRLEIVEDVLAREEIPTPVVRLTRLLVERGRVTLIADVADAFGQLVDERLHRVAASVTTAAPLTADQETRLREALSRYSGKEVRLECSVDRNLITGVVARLNGEVIDGSLRTRLDHLKEALIAQEM